MKHVKHLLVLLLLVNCTTDVEETDIDTTPEVSVENSNMLNCVDDLPKIRLTNNGTHSFEFIVYAEDYSVLYTQNISATANTGWIELTNNDVLAVVQNSISYGQKVPLNLQLCDNLELEIDLNNVLVVY